MASARFPSLPYLFLTLSMGANVYLLVNRDGEGDIRADEMGGARVLEGGGRPTRSPEPESADLLELGWRDISSSRKRMIAWEGWASRDPLGVLDHACGAAEGTDREEMVASVISIWAESDPSAASKWLENAPAGLRGEAVYQALVEVWARSEPSIAAGWFATQDDPTMVASIAEVLAGTWAETDGASAVRWVQSNWPDGEAGTALNLAMEVWAENDADGLRNALGSFGDEVLEIEASKEVGSFLAETDGEAAWQFADSLADPAARYESMVVVMETWADNKPSAAARAVDACGDETIRVDATRALVGKWILSDEDLALEWLAGVKPGRQADAGYDAAVEQWLSTRPLKALGLALKIGDPPTRGEAIALAHAELTEADPAAARKWVQANDLPAEIRRGLGDEVDE